MTTYSATFNNSTTTTTLSVVAGTYEIRVPKIELSWLNTAGASGGIKIQGFVYFNSSAPSGGSTASVTPLRQGSPAATVTAKSGVTIPGGAVVLASYGSVVVGDPTTSAGGGGSTWTFEPPFDFIISPGAAVIANITQQGTGSGMINTYFEELRLSWPY